MNDFSYRNDELFVEEIACEKIAQKFSTPTYIYSLQTLKKNYHVYESALSDINHLIAYSVKANSNIAVLKVLADMGSGFDIVSVGELERVMIAGGNPNKIVFSGVGKQYHEIKRALEVGIYCFNVESESELQLIHLIAKSMNQKAPVSFRVNPDVDAKTHPYISTGLKENKFGIDIDQASELYQRASTLPYIKIVGIDFHIGSQILTGQPFFDAVDKIVVLLEELSRNNIQLFHIDIGGGIGVVYQQETPPHITEVMNHIKKQLKDTGLMLIVEPGRSIVANAGILLTQVDRIKCTAYNNFVILDAAMNDLIRPALYGAWHEIQTVSKKTTADINYYDVVGSICETGDYLGKKRLLCVSEGDLVAIMSTGAYGFGMSSNYNSRNRCAEIMVDGEKMHMIRRRETINDQLALEKLII